MKKLQKYSKQSDVKIRKDKFYTDDEIIEPTFSDLKNIWFYSIVPLIEEYCGFDKNRVEELLTKGDKKLSKKEDFILDKLKGTWN